MNFCRKMINRYSVRKSRRRYRHYQDWTFEYPSPGPSIIGKTAGRIGNWVYNRVDYFFSGTSVELPFYYDDGNSTSINPDVAYCQEWELNQDIADIAYKDIEAGLRCLVPVCFRHWLNKVYQNVCIYFQADYTVQEEYSELHKMCLIFNNKSSDDIEKRVIIIEPQIEVKAIKIFLFSNLIKGAVYKLNTVLRLRKIKKTYYLPENTTTSIYEYYLDKQNCMIRGPDRSKLNPAISFHIRN